MTVAGFDLMRPRNRNISQPPESFDGMNHTSPSRCRCDLGGLTDVAQQAGGILLSTFTGFRVGVEQIVI